MLWWLGPVVILGVILARRRTAKKQKALRSDASYWKR